MTMRHEQCPDGDRKYPDPVQSAWLVELRSLSPIEANSLVLQEGRRLLDTYSLDDWCIGINQKTKTWLGQCDRSRKSIDIAKCFLDRGPTTDVLLDLLLHEIAHALTVGGHNLAWKRTYAKLLTSHFDSEIAAEFLDGDRYCRKYLHRLLGELKISSGTKTQSTPLRFIRQPTSTTIL